MNKKKLSKLKIKGVQHYAEVMYPGLIFPKFKVQKVAERTQDQIKFYKDACAFRFFDCGYVKEKVNGKYVKQPSGKINVSSQTYIGEYLTPEQIAKEYGKDSTLYHNVTYDGHRYVGAVKTAARNTFGLMPEDKVIDPSQVKYVDQANEQDAERVENTNADSGREM